MSRAATLICILQCDYIVEKKYNPDEAPELYEKTGTTEGGSAMLTY